MSKTQKNESASLWTLLSTQLLSAKDYSAGKEDIAIGAFSSKKAEKPKGSRVWTHPAMTLTSCVDEIDTEVADVRPLPNSTPKVYATTVPPELSCSGFFSSYSSHSSHLILWNMQENAIIQLFTVLRSQQRLVLEQHLPFTHRDASQCTSALPGIGLPTCNCPSFEVYHP